LVKLDLSRGLGHGRKRPKWGASPKRGAFFGIS